MDFLKSIGGLLMGPGAMEDNPIDAFKMYAAPGLEGVLTPEQQAAYGRQIQTAMRRINSDYRPNFVQMQNAVNQGLIHKVDIDAKMREMKLQDLIDNELNGGAPAPAPAPSAPLGSGAQVGAVPEMPPLTPANAETKLPDITVTPPPLSAAKSKAAIYRRIGDKLAPFDSAKANSYYSIADKLDPKVTYTSPIEVTGADGRPMLVQPDSEGNLSPVAGFTPKQALPDYLDAFRYLYKREPDFANPADKAAIEHLAKISRPGTTVNVGEQQGFKNEKDLRQEFSGLPITKAFTEVQTAYDQIRTALSRPSAANDLVAATKFMKLLDPNSVVRESELGMAMAATGVLDRAQNYFAKLQTGQVLTPSQRADFLQSATALYNAAYGRYAPVVDQYRGYASSYNLNPDRVVRGPGVAPPTSVVPPTQNDPLGIRRPR